jgi:mRNA interferase RelE/StbE
VVSYSVLIKPSAAKEMENIPKRDLQRIVKRIRLLADNPRPVGSEKLSGDEKYRIRQGDYRVVYAIDDQSGTVVVVKVGYRREIYRGRDT